MSEMTSLIQGVRRKKTDIAIGINNMTGNDNNCPVIDHNKQFHTHSDPETLDQCNYELRLLETVLMPTFDKIMSGTLAQMLIMLQ